MQKADLALFEEESEVVERHRVLGVDLDRTVHGEITQGIINGSRRHNWSELHSPLLGRQYGTYKLSPLEASLGFVYFLGIILE